MVAELMTMAPDGLYIPLDRIRDDLPQVRRDWGYDGGKQKLDELDQSIRQHGVLQPIEVSPRENGLYDVLVGHRRFDAARRVGLASIPAIVRVATEKERCLLQLVENIVRQDLSFVDQAQAMQDMIDANQWSRRELAQRLGVLPYRVYGVLHVFDDPTLRVAVQRKLIPLSGATQLLGLHLEYSTPLYDTLRAGEHVGYNDVMQAQRHQQEAGVRKDAGSSKRGIRDPKTNERLSRARTMREAGASHQDIADALGIKKNSVGELLRRSAHPISEPKGTIDDLRSRAHELKSTGMPASGIAGALGVTRKTVYKYLKADGDEPVHNDSAQAGLNVTIDLPTRMIVHAEPITPPTPSAVRSPLPLYNPDTPEERVALLPVAIQPTWTDLFAALPSGPFVRVLTRAAGEGMTAAALLEAYRANRMQ